MSSPAVRPKGQSNHAVDYPVDGLSEVAPGGSTGPLPLDVVFDLLSNERRRRVLRYLVSESDPITLGDLAEHVASIENDKPASALTSTERKRVYVALYQCHLPRLDDAAVIDFDDDRKTVDVGSNADQLIPYLRVSPEDDRGYPTVLLGVCSTVAIVAAVQIVLFPSAWLTGLLAGVFLASVASAAVEFVR